ncbi:MAG TPA: iron ABC transporter permease, partial [Chloroflexia bacterium]|nr:iron ABC transporter permease [Chloroflexia bacterium]
MLATERRLLAIREWRRARGVAMPPLLLALALVSGLVAVTPLVYIVVRAAGVSPDVWGRLWSGRVPGLLANTLMLVACTAVLTAGLGLGLAWLVERTDLPGRNFWRWVLALPLAVPAYVGALCYLIVLRRGGLLEQWLISLGWVEFGQVPLPSL